LEVCKTGALTTLQRRIFAAAIVRGQAEDSRKARFNHDEFDEELSEQEGRLAL
jgi:hypothetical protein